MSLLLDALKKAADDKEMDELDRRYKEAMILAAKARSFKTYEDVKKGKKMVALAEEDKKQGYDRLISKDEGEITKIDDQIKGLGEEERKGYGTINNSEKISDLRVRKTTIKRHIDEKRKKQKMTGAEKGETRKFASDESIAAAQRSGREHAAKFKKPATEAEIRKSMVEKGKSPAKINLYINYLKKQGKLQ